jgi:type I restriction enzyme S subunit
MISLEGAKAFAPWAQTLPAGWRLGRLKSLASIRYGLGQPPALLESGVAMIRATDVDAGTIRTDKLLRIDPLELPEGRNAYLRAGEIIVVRSGAYTGDSAIVPPDLEGAVAGYDMVVTVTRDSPRFIAYCLLSRHVLEDQIHLLTLRAAQPHLNVQELGSVVVALPQKRSEQETIADYLDASCAAIDAAMAAKRLQIEALDDLGESLIESIVTTGIKSKPVTRRVDADWINEIPAHWNACRIKRVVTRVDYGISEKTEVEGRFPVLKMGHIQRRELAFSNVDYVDDVHDDLLLENGDLLYNRTNSPDQVGKAAVFRGEKSDRITFASYLVRLRANHRADPFFLNYLLNSSGFLGFARKLAIPSVQQSNLNSTRYCRIRIPLPPLDEQREITTFLDTKLAEARRVVASITAQIETLTAYRKSLIHECVTGERRVTEGDLRRACNIHTACVAGQAS